MRLFISCLFCLHLCVAGEITPVSTSDLDFSVYAEWVDGNETILESEKKDTGPSWILTTREFHPGHSGLRFGHSNSPGPRHLRIGFKKTIPVGSIITRGQGTISVLKSGVTYPGDLANPDHWMPAQLGNSPARDSADAFALWVLPTNTQTRALRITHQARDIDPSYAGHFKGAFIHPDRLLNLASEAKLKSSSPRDLDKLTNGQHDGWGAWANVEKNQSPGSASKVSRESPHWITLRWPKPVTLDRLALLWSGLGEIDLQIPTPNERNPPWKTVQQFPNLKNNYPHTLAPQFLDLSKAITTDSIRLLITAPANDSSHASTNEGKRIWIGELLALNSLQSAPLPKPKIVTANKAAQAPVTIPFTLEKDGYVTLVIERPDGFRIRNLISETYFPAGSHTIGWDGTDDLGRDVDAANHGVYRIPKRFTQPGHYQVRGLIRDEIKAFYEFTVYTSGNPSWPTPDHTGAWIANHSPPQAAAFVPAKNSPTGEDVVYLGSYVTEGPDGLAWVDLDGTKKGGQKWIGGHWTAAPFLAADTDPGADPNTHVYVASAWETRKGSNIGELRLTALTKKGDREILKHQFGELNPPPGQERAHGQIGGLIVHDQYAIVSLTQKNQLLQIDTRTGEMEEVISIPSPRGLAVNPTSETLLILSKDKLLSSPAPGKFDPLIENLEDPRGITLDQKGNIYISDHGHSHQVKVFSPTGKFLQAIGKPGPPTAGPYDPLHMNHPHGIAIDSRNQLWVTENDYLPKRVSVWSLKGEFIKAFYGPAKYGGGGSLDPIDKTKFYYADEEKGSLEFELDWTEGSWVLKNVLTREPAMELPFRSATPEQALYHQGRRYFTNAFNSNPTGGHKTAFLFTESKHTLQPAAGMGQAGHWELLKTKPFHSRWPEGSAPEKDSAFFIWSDINNDALAQPNEVTIHPAKNTGGITIHKGLTFLVARVDGKALALPPNSFSSTGVPSYSFAEAKVLAEDVKNPASSGGDQLLLTGNGQTIITLGHGPFDQRSISGAKEAKAQWSYPSPWPGLHASHKAPRPDRPGQLIGTTRLPGGLFEVEGSKTGPLWALHSNHGRMAVFTADGLFVATLFEDMRGGIKWRMPVEKRGMNLKGLTIGEENFWPTLTHTSEGKVYLVDGNRSAIIRLEGFESLRPIPPIKLKLTAQLLEECNAWTLAQEIKRQESGSNETLLIPTNSPRKVDGELQDWQDSQWAQIDSRGIKAYFNANSEPYDIRAALAISGDHLYAAWKTGNPNLLVNSNEMPLAPFKTGGALDLMIGPDGNRKSPAEGDLRLLITLKDHKPHALLYRAVMPGTSDDKKIPFSSPWRTITFDEVLDVSEHLKLSAKDGNYEISIPYKLLGIQPGSGKTIRGDLGILRGTNGETNARIYWNNKATGITADVPSEAQLTPELWGRFRFKN
ncbi:MAG: hypothetical protein P1U90_10510 [Akkermansiaceae bacterium]|nr:hypothetical protein [Akkermansiaceae bacterium]